MFTANYKTQRDGLGPHFNSGVGTLVKIDGIYVTKKSSKYSFYFDVSFQRTLEVDTEHPLCVVMS